MSIGLIMSLAIVVVAVLAPVIAPYDPVKQDLRSSLERPSPRHLFGTDALGRDILSRIIYGSRISLLIGGAAISLALCVGGLAGLISGYHGGYIDVLFQRAVDVLMSFPSIVLALLIVATLGGSSYSVIVAIAVYNTAYFIRLVRAQVLQARGEVYVEAARATGASVMRILFRHVTPNIAMPVIILATLRLSGAILIEASLSYLGLGVPPPTPSWGNIVADGQKYIFTAPWISIFGGAAVMLAVLGLNLLGDRLRDVLDPRLRGGL